MGLQLTLGGDFLYNKDDGIPYTYDLTTAPMESIRQIGFDLEEGLPKYVYINYDKPIIIETLDVNNVYAKADDWKDIIDIWEDQINEIEDSGLKKGKLYEDITVEGIERIDIVANKYLYKGSYKETYYGDLSSNPPPKEFNILITDSANIQPSGFFTNGDAFFDNKYYGITYTRTSICDLNETEKYIVGEKYASLGFILSKSISGLKVINNETYCDLSLTYLKEDEAEIQL